MATQGTSYSFEQWRLPTGYFDRLFAENFDNLNVLLPPSYNCEINENGNISQRKGYQVLNGSNLSNNPVINMMVWRSTTNREFLIKSLTDSLQVYYDLIPGQETYVEIFSGFKTNNFFRGASWYNGNEFRDLWVMVNNSSNLISWSGGITEILSTTTNTITKKYSSLSSVANSIVFTPATGNSSATIQWTNNNYQTAGFKAGDIITISNSTNNNGQYSIKSVDNGIIYLSDNLPITAETNTTGAIVGVLGKETWLAERFLSATPINGRNYTNKQVRINGNIYNYTGGETTPILTGLSPVGSAPALNTYTTGVIITQQCQIDLPVNGDVQPGLLLNTIFTFNNHLIIGNVESRAFYGSNILPITTTTPAQPAQMNNFSYTTVGRYVGEGFTIILDYNFNSIWEDSNNLYVSSGRNDISQISFNQFIDNLNKTLESVSVVKVKSASLQSMVTPECFVNGKDGIYYLSQEQSVNFFGFTTQQNIYSPKPLISTISYDIKNLINSLDLTGEVYAVYLRNKMYFYIQNSQVMIQYDEIRRLWQPPHFFTFNCIVLYKGNIIAGSISDSNCYILYTGNNDNGIPIQSNVTFNTKAVSDYTPSRTTLKNTDSFYLEGLVNQNIKSLKGTILLGYKGSSKSVDLTIAYGQDGAEGKADTQNDTPLGFTPLGSVAIGGSNAKKYTIFNSLQKFRQIKAFPRTTYYTYQFVIESPGDADGYYEIICHGLKVDASQAVDLSVFSE